MTEKTLILICLALLVLCVALLFALLLKKGKTAAETKNDGGMDALKEKMDKLGGIADYTNKSITSLGSMTEYRLNNMQKTMTDQLRYVVENNQRSLDEIRRTVDTKLSETLETKLTESYAVIQQRLEAVYRGIGEVQSLAASVSDIKKVFSNVKLRGTWGETQLGALLSQMLAPNQYAASVKLNPLADGMVDFAVLLPDKNGSCVYLPIDSKFPVEEYQRLIDAENACNREAEEKAMRNLGRAVKLQAESIASKYILPPRTTDFAVMVSAHRKSVRGSVEDSRFERIPLFEEDPRLRSHQFERAFVHFTDGIQGVRDRAPLAGTLAASRRFQARIRKIHRRFGKDAEKITGGAGYHRNGGGQDARHRQETEKRRPGRAGR